MANIVPSPTSSHAATPSSPFWVSTTTSLAPSQSTLFGTSQAAPLSAGRSNAPLGSAPSTGPTPVNSSHGNALFSYSSSSSLFGKPASTTHNIFGSAIKVSDLGKSEKCISKSRHDKFLEKLTWLFNNPKYSDVTIKIFDVVFHAHQNVICTQSQYFEKAFQSGSQSFSEADTKKIEFKEGSGAAYWRVLEYLYTGDYSDHLSTKELAEDPELLKDVHVYGLADMFLIDDLKAIAEAKLKKRIQNCQLDDTFSTCVREIYKTTHSIVCKMRLAVVEHAVNRTIAWEKSPLPLISKIHEMSHFKLLLQEGGEFVSEYFMAMSSTRCNTK
ncbi:hypothetical protein K3495_g10809 [Podosphaera aphanis]|nr:hypothetical protein K3495_g10809 [Podosphaera aphanis]